MLGCLLAAALCADGYLGFFTRYAADDFSTSATVRSLGFWEAQKYWFTTWSGRYTATAAITAVEKLGPAFVRWLPAIILLFWAATLGYLLWRLALSLRWNHPVRNALFLDCLILFLTLHTTFNRGLTLYWLTGVMTYTLPVVACSACIGILQHWLARRQRTTIAMLLLTFVSSLLLAGTSETFAAILLVSLLLGDFSTRILKKTTTGISGSVRALMWVAVLGTLSAVGIMLLAPGTAIREHTLTRPPNLFAASYLSIRLGCYFIIRLVVCQWDKFLLATLIPAVLSSNCRTDREPSRRWLFVLPAFALVLSITAFFPAAFMYFAPLAGYALGTSQFVLISIVMAWGYVAGCQLQRRFQPRRKFANVLGYALALVLAIVPAIVTHQEIRARITAAEYAHDWDHLDSRMRSLKANGVGQVVSEPPPWHLSNTNGLEVPGSDPHYWVNEAIASYYGFKSVTFKGRDFTPPSDNWTPGCCGPLWQRFKRAGTAKTLSSK